MKKAILLLGCLSLLLTGIIRASSNDSDELKGAISFTFTGKKVTFIATAQTMVVDWGDGKTNEYTGHISPSHTYRKSAEHTVRIQEKGLSYFYCREQQITALDVSNNTELTMLDCSNNQLTVAALHDLFASLPALAGLPGSISIWYNPGAAYCNRSIAITKGWSVIGE
jgi:Leucine-rich repeat (LRR) protein